MRCRIFMLPEHLERLVYTPFCHPFTLSAQLPASCTTSLQLPITTSSLTFGNFWSIFYLNFLLQLKPTSVSFGFCNMIALEPKFLFVHPFLSFAFEFSLLRPPLNCYDLFQDVLVLFLKSNSSYSLGI